MRDLRFRMWDLFRGCLGLRDLREGLELIFPEVSNDVRPLAARDDKLPRDDHGDEASLVGQSLEFKLKLAGHVILDMLSDWQSVL